MSKNHRILFAMMSLPPDMVGGAPVMLHRLMTHLPPESVRVVACSGGQPDEAAFDRSHTFPITRLPVVFSYARPPRQWGHFRLMGVWLRALWSQVRRDDIAVFAISNPFYQGFGAVLVSWLRRVPYLTFNFGEELAIVWENRRSARGRWRWWLYRWTLRHATRVIVISRATRQTALQFGVDPSRIETIHPPTPARPAPDNVAVARFRQTHALQDRRIVASVGRLIRRKGHDRLLEAWPGVVAQCPDAVLVIASTGPLEDELRALVRRLQIDAYVRFLGGVDGATLDVLYAACEVFVMPNRTLPNGDQEGYGIVFNEANAFGKPVIGGDSGGTPDAIVHGVTGLLVDGSSAAAIEQAIVHLLTDRAFATKLGKQGQAWVQAERSPQAAARRFMTLVRQVEAE